MTSLFEHGAQVGQMDRDGWLHLAFLGANIDVRVKVEEVNGLPEIVGLRIAPIGGSAMPGLPSDPPVPLTGAVMRSLPLRQLKDAYLDAQRGGRYLEVLHGPVPKGPAPRSREHFEAVANVYQANIGRRPRKAVEEHFGVSRAGASKYIRQARQLGILDWPERKGVGGASAAASPFAGPPVSKSRRRKR